ncbi:ser thr protein phosphatase family [Colletotrichum truncatum]|uniref:Ser thr protein phosphatase family n=1 Tax=Colletotrichum truncatum TaxID=5467 RepID=A0ACC3Z008_COLTU|nr:ser thr protein phosphatase family [Colletotrichum truncatum]KAF6800852.1 ser thr protein phosphatase family [Colletotrichum truncatum]
MTFPAPARPRRGAVCVLAFFVLTTLFLALARLTSFDLPIISRRPEPKEEPKPSPADAPMSYGDTARPGFTDLSVHINTLPEHHVPSRSNPGRRLIIVGDVHGMRESLDTLLTEVHFDTARGDHLVLAGDMINKGPDSRGVIDLAMRLGASAVRGNHEDRVLLAHRGLKKTYVADEDAHGNPAPAKSDNESDNESDTNTEDNDDDLEPAIFPHGDAVERRTARSLSKKHIDWLSELPVILDVGSIESLGNVVVVHAGLVPGLTLKQQDPWAVMNMRGLVYPREELRRKEAKNALEDYRKIHTAAPGITDNMINEEHERRRKPEDRTIAVPTDRRDGSSSWTKAWNRHQKALPATEPRTAVVYGHDSKKGLEIDKYTFGLDSGCVNGGELSALVIEATTEGVTHEIKSVKCEKDDGKKKKKGKKSKKDKTS